MAPRPGAGSCPACWAKKKAPSRALCCSGSGGTIRTSDLQVMSLTSCHCSTPQRIEGWPSTEVDYNSRPTPASTPEQKSPPDRPVAGRGALLHGCWCGHRGLPGRRHRDNQMLPGTHQASLTAGPLGHRGLARGSRHAGLQIGVLDLEAGHLSLKLDGIALKSPRIGHPAIQVSQDQYGKHHQDDEPGP